MVSPSSRTNFLNGLVVFGPATVELKAGGWRAKYIHSRRIVVKQDSKTGIKTNIRLTNG
jgi:hypothetical protein